MTLQDPSVNKKYTDEISLLDLATILLKYWKIIAIIFFGVIFAALIYALLMPRVYNYTSIYNIAEQGAGNALESPRSLVAKVRNLYIGPVTRKLLTDTGIENLPFELKIENPEETFLVTLTSKANEADQKLVTQLHTRILARLKQEQHTIVERRIRALERQLKSTKVTLETAQKSDSLGAAEVMVSIMNRIASLEANIEEIREGEVDQTAVRSLEPVGISRKVILASGIFIGLVLSLLTIFLIVFVKLVAAKLDGDNKS